MLALEIPTFAKLLAHAELDVRRAAVSLLKSLVDYCEQRLREVKRLLTLDMKTIFGTHLSSSSPFSTDYLSIQTPIPN